MDKSRLELRSEFCHNQPTLKLPVWIYMLKIHSTDNVWSVWPSTGRSEKLLEAGIVEKKNCTESETSFPSKGMARLFLPVVYLVLYNQTPDGSYRHPATFAYVMPARIKITHCVVWCRIQHTKSQVCSTKKRLKGLQFKKNPTFNASAVQHVART